MHLTRIMIEYGAGFFVFDVPAKFDLCCNCRPASPAIHNDPFGDCLMEPLFAFDISTDDIIKAVWSYWPAITTTIGSGLLAMYFLIRKLWRQFIDFVKPMIVKLYQQGSTGFEKHNALVDTFIEYVPFVSKELEKTTQQLELLASGQDEQSKVVTGISKAQEDHGQKLETLLKTMTVKNV